MAALRPTEPSCEGGSRIGPLTFDTLMRTIQLNPIKRRSTSMRSRFHHFMLLPSLWLWVATTVILAVGGLIRIAYDALGAQ